MKTTKAILTAILLLSAGLTAAAESTWTVTNDNGASNTFTIKRSETGYAQKVLYRTISLSAYAGQHYTAKYGELEFLANEDTKTITVSELTPTGAYLYYKSGTTVKYGFEVTDRAGYRLAYAERSKTWGTSVPASGIFDEKSVTVNSGTITVTDDDYVQAYHAVPLDSYFSAAAPKAYLAAVKAQLRMTLSFKAKEKDDGYQHVQILVNQTSNHDEGSGDNNPGTINYSSYMACFVHQGGSTNTTYSNYVFPDVNHGDLCGKVGKVWSSINSSNDVGELRQQKFNTGCRASDGTLIIADHTASGVISSVSGLNYLGIRFDASGDNEDTWYAYNTVAHIQAVDGTNPTKSAVSVNPGRHAKGNPFYVSVAFSEIVTVTGTPTLSTTSENKWGTLSYETGSGTNVLTFKGTIQQDATGDLNVTGLSGTVKDLAGNSLSGGVTASGLCSLDSDLVYTLSDFKYQNDRYLITCHDDLRGLAGYVNAGNDASGKTFRQVTDLAFPHTTDWDNDSSTENNFTRIGDQDHPFKGTYDGDGHTISGIRIYKGGSTWADAYQGLFGQVGDGGTVKRITLADTRITGRQYTGGIAGKTFSCTIDDCTVEADVCIHAVQSSTYYHGGIVGSNQAGPVRRCISRARLTVADPSGCMDFGGIVGKNLSNTITDCIADGVIIPNVYGRGAIVGYKNDGTLTRNFYRGCTVAGVGNAIGVGQGNSESSTETSDVTGAHALWAITLPEHASLVRSKMADLPGTDNRTYAIGADIAGAPYAAASMSQRISYDSASLSEGYTVRLTAQETSSGTPVTVTDRGDYTYDLTMPAADVTVNAEIVPIISYIDENGAEQGCKVYTTLTSSDSNVTLGSSGSSTPVWYIVPAGTVTINGSLYINDPDVRLIVCDGATLTINTNGNAIRCQHGSLTIYGQTQQSGIINATATYQSGNAINSYGGDITINGCTVNATALENAIETNNADIVINRGTITATSSSNGNGIVAGTGGNVIINGGTISASGSGSGRGIWVDGTITLGCATATDRITVSSYYAHNGTVSIKDGQALTDNTALYTGTLTDDQKTAIAGKTLRNTVTVPYIDANGDAQSHLFCISILNETTTYGNAGNAEMWYCVSDNVTISGTQGVKFLDQAVHIILCDGATLTSNATTSDYCGLEVTNGSLAIYAQAGGSGSIVATAQNKPAISSKTNMDLNGGNISGTNSQDGIGIVTEETGSLTIRRGHITGTGANGGIRGWKGLTILGGTVSASGTNIGLYSNNGNISILGGIVNATGKAASAVYTPYPHTITLGCSSVADRITATGYSCGSLIIATGQTLTNGISTFTGTLNSNQISSISGRTLRLAFDPAESTKNLTAHQATIAGQTRYWATFYHPLWSYALPVDAQAFILKTDKALYRVGNGTIVPANCAVVIMAESASITLSATNSNAPEVSGNILQGTSAATAAPAGAHVLSKVSETFGFFGFTGEIPANKAYYVE